MLDHVRDLPLHRHIEQDKEIQDQYRPEHRYVEYREERQEEANQHRFGA